MSDRFDRAERWGVCSTCGIADDDPDGHRAECPYREDVDDHEPSVCDVCGTDEHTAAELAECLASAIAPRPLPLCDVCGSPEPCDDPECVRERAWQRAAWAEQERDTLHLWRNR